MRSGVQRRVVAKHEARKQQEGSRFRREGVPWERWGSEGGEGRCEDVVSPETTSCVQCQEGWKASGGTVGQ